MGNKLSSFLEGKTLVAVEDLLEVKKKSAAEFPDYAVRNWGKRQYRKVPIPGHSPVRGEPISKWTPIPTGRKKKPEPVLPKGAKGGAAPPDKEKEAKLPKPPKPEDAPPLVPQPRKPKEVELPLPEGYTKGPEAYAARVIPLVEKVKKETFVFDSYIGDDTATFRAFVGTLGEDKFVIKGGRAHVRLSDDELENETEPKETLDLDIKDTLYLRSGVHRIVEQLGRGDLVLAAVGAVARREYGKISEDSALLATEAPPEGFSTAAFLSPDVLAAVAEEDRVTAALIDFLVCNSLRDELAVLVSEDGKILLIDNFLTFWSPAPSSRRPEGTNSIFFPDEVLGFAKPQDTVEALPEAAQDLILLLLTAKDEELFDLFQLKEEDLQGLRERSRLVMDHGLAGAIAQLNAEAGEQETPPNPAPHASQTAPGNAPGDATVPQAPDSPPITGPAAGTLRGAP